MMTELAKGKTIEEALQLTDDDVVLALGGIPERKKQLLSYGCCRFEGCVTGLLQKRCAEELRQQMRSVHPSFLQVELPLKTRNTELRKKILRLRPIGIIRSPFKTVVGMPIQTVFSKKRNGIVELFPEFKEGLRDLEGFSHIMLIYQFHQSKGYRLVCRPFFG